MLRHAWPSSTNEELVHRLRKQGVISKDSVSRAMLAIDRHNYVSSDASSVAYLDQPMGIGYNQTISAPHMHAHALNLLADHLVPGAHALDVGCGSGYLSACMAEMVGVNGKVVGIEYIQPLVELSKANISKHDARLFNIERLIVKQGDGWKGCPELAPFDCIHVGVAAATLPEALVEQLKLGGRMVIPVGTIPQKFYQVDKAHDGTIVKTPIMDVTYVPLVRHLL